MSNEPDEVNSGALATMIVLLFVATFAIALAVTALVRDEVDEVRAERDLTQERAFRLLRAEQRAALTGAPSWSDAENNLVKVSVQRSMEIVVANLRSNPYALTATRPQKEEEVEEPAEGEGEETQGTEVEVEGKDSSDTPGTPAAQDPAATATPVKKAAASPAKKPVAPAAKIPAATKPAVPAAKTPAAPATKPPVPATTP